MEPEEDDGGGDPRAAIGDELVGLEQLGRNLVGEGSVAGTRDVARDRVDRLDLPAIPLGNTGVDDCEAVVLQPRLELLGLDRVVVDAAGR